MKLIQQTLKLTKEEKEKFVKLCEKVSLSFGDVPCGFVDCDDISCDFCPFSAVQDRFTDFQKQLIKVKNMIK